MDKAILTYLPRYDVSHHHIIFSEGDSMGSNRKLGEIRDPSIFMLYAEAESSGRAQVEMILDPLSI